MNVKHFNLPKMLFATDKNAWLCTLTLSTNIQTHACWHKMHSKMRNELDGTEICMYVCMFWFIKKIQIITKRCDPKGAGFCNENAK